MANHTSPVDSQQSQHILDKLVTFRLVRMVTFMMPRAPWWVRAIVFSFVVTASVVGLSLLVGEPPFLFTLHVAIWLGFVPIGLVLTNLVYRETLQTFFTEVVPELPPDAVQNIQTHLQDNFSPRKQALLAGLASGLATLVLGLALYLNLSMIVTPATYASIFAVAAFAVNVMHLGALLIAASNRFVVGDVTLYPLAPRHSKVVRGLTVVGRRLVWTMIIMATILVIATSVSPFSLLALTTAGVQYLAVVVVMGVPFVLQRRNIARLVDQRRARTIDELQAEIAELYANRDNLTAEQRDRFDYLMGLHVAVTGGEKNTTLGSISETLRYVSPLLLPLLALIISNLNLPFGEDILKLLEPVLSP